MRTGSATNQPPSGEPVISYRVKGLTRYQMRSIHPGTELNQMFSPAIPRSATAHRILVEDGRAVGIENDKGTFRAAREVIVSTGAIDTQAAHARRDRALRLPGPQHLFLSRTIPEANPQEDLLVTS